MPRAARTLWFFILLSLAAAASAADRSIVVLGDSLSAAYGMPQARGWVALLAERLKRERPDYIVVNASVSGDTSGGGRARLKPLLERHRPVLLIVELGGNDGLRGLPIPQLRANLSAIIEQAQQAGARVLLLGMRMPPNYGPDYTASFEAAFRDLATKHRTGLVPFFLEDFIGNPDFFLDDRLHPNEKAQPLMLRRVWPALQQFLPPRVR